MNEILIRGCIKMEFLKKHELWLLIINVILFLAITSVESQINKIIFFIIFILNNILIYLVQKNNSNK